MATGLDFVGLSGRRRNSDSGDMKPGWRGKCAVIVEHDDTSCTTFGNDNVVRCRDVKNATARKLDKEGLERLRVFELFYLPDHQKLMPKKG